MASYTRNNHTVCYVIILLVDKQVCVMASYTRNNHTVCSVWNII